MGEPHYIDPTVTLYAGDCLDVLRELPDASVDAVVTDPPYGLEFMGREWDSFKQRDPRTAGRAGAGAITGGAGVGGVDESLPSRPSGVLFDKDKRQARGVSYGGKRPMTLECDTCGVRSPIDKKHSSKTPDCPGTWIAVPMYPDAPSPLKPFQDWCQQWATECLRVLKPGGHLLAFGGTRTSHRLACAIEDAGFEIRDSIAWLYGSGFPKSLNVANAISPIIDPVTRATDPARDALADPWQGWGTALKPAHEPIVVARKPLSGTVAQSVLTHGTGALNIDACRVAHASDADLATSQAKNPGRADTVTSGVYGAGRPQQSVNTAGRWPANVVLDESQAAALDEQSGETSERPRILQRNGERQMDGWGLGAESQGVVHGDSGGASRYFYTAKAASTERVRVDGVSHPTVKPLSLMRWLVRLVTPPGGTVLEPFAGSGTTVEACILEGFRCIAIEREADYLPLITQRIHRRRDPVEAVRGSGEDGGLFDLLDGGAA